MRNLCISLAVLSFSLPALAQSPRLLSLPAGGHTQLDISGLTRLTIKDPTVADVKVLGGGTFEIDAFCPGKTNLIAWAGKQRYDFAVEVTGTPANPETCEAKDAPAAQATTTPSPSAKVTREVALAVGETQTFSASQTQAISIANPKIADAHPRGEDAFAVEGRTPGTTTLILVRLGQPVETWRITVH